MLMEDFQKLNSSGKGALPNNRKCIMAETMNVDFIILVVFKFQSEGSHKNCEDLKSKFFLVFTLIHSDLYRSRSMVALILQHY